MTSVLPLRPSIDHSPRERTVLELSTGKSSDVLDSLGSETARALLEALEDGPATASDLRDAVGTSLQNVHYHLRKLGEANLVAQVGTWHSAKGTEMRVYGLTTERVELRLADSPRP